MARKFTFHTFRLVALRDDNYENDDVFVMQVLLDGVPTEFLPKEKKTEAANFMFEFFKKFGDEAIRMYEERRAGDVQPTT